MRLAIIITHPIRYVVPLFKLLSARKKIDVKVFYTFGPDLLKFQQFNSDYRKSAEPEVPLFDGYKFELVENIAKNKNSFSYTGIDNPELNFQIKKWHADAILVFGWNFKSHFKALRYFKKKIPVYFRGDSTLLDEDNQSFLKKTVRELALTWVYRYIDRALYVGTNNRNYYKKFGLKDNQLIYAPHAIDNNRFANFPNAEMQALIHRREMNIGDKDTVFLFAGKFTAKKNPLLLVNSFLKASIKNTHLLFVGTGDLEGELKRMAHPYPNIHFMPFQTQTMMPVIYRMGNLFILPSQGPEETWGLVLNEAMACGLAVAATNKCGSAVDLIEHEKNGYIFRSNDVEQLTRILIEFSADKNKKEQMGNYSREKIKHFSYDKLVPVIESIAKP